MSYYVLDYHEKTQRERNIESERRMKLNYVKGEKIKFHDLDKSFKRIIAQGQIGTVTADHGNCVDIIIENTDGKLKQYGSVLKRDIKKENE